MGRLSTRLSRRAWVSVSIQWRSSKTSKSGCTWLSRKSTRLRASRVRRRRWGGSRLRNALILRQGVQQPQQRGMISWRARPASAPAPSPWLGWCGSHRGLPPAHSASAGPDGKIGCRLAVGHRGALQHPPALDVVRMDHSRPSGISPPRPRPPAATTWPCPAPACSTAWYRASSSPAAPQSASGHAHGPLQAPP